MADSPSIARNIPLTTNEAFSGIFGTVSVTCWVFLLLPQLYENYKAGSGDSISLAFIFVWLIGDITNLAGAVWAKLVPTVVATAIWFCVMDVVLIAQCIYYKIKNRHTQDPPDDAVDRRESTGSFESPETPLLSRRESAGSHHSGGLPGSHRRRQSAATLKHTRTNSMASIPEEYSTYVSGPSKEAIKNVLSIMVVFGVGAAAWSIFWQLGFWKPSPPPGHGHGDSEPQPLGAEILGYISAISYLGARLPQIYKNWQAKSCEGLSLLFFILSLFGNLTYGIGILAHSLEKSYILKNLPWLIGSLGTMFEDSTIFAQFRIYGDRSDDETIE